MCISFRLGDEPRLWIMSAWVHPSPCGWGSIWGCHHVRVLRKRSTWALTVTGASFRERGVLASTMSAS